MDILNQLTEHFRKFPGIGPRQAKRFAYFLFKQDPEIRHALAQAIQSIENEIHTCEMCFRYFTSDSRRSPLCNICKNDTRDHSTLMVVAHDIDCENIEKSGSYNGYYFILGGIVPILENEPTKRVRATQLFSRVEKDASAGTLKEVILALNPNPDGENTQDYISQLLSPIRDSHSISISTLGRGLSTGLELEYSDSDTIKNSLKNRSRN